MNSKVLKTNLKKPASRKEVIEKFCKDKRVLDLGCIHHDLDNVNTENWLHSIVVNASKHALGVDYLEDEVNCLIDRGYNVIVGDVNRRLPIEEKFDVIIIGNLIEHLSSFSGLLQNVSRLLLPDGVALISTANPFYREQYFYTALKNDIIVNPEHTCWIDPVTLDQLARRFQLETQEVFWIKEKWKLSDVIFHGPSQKLNMYNGIWDFTSIPSARENLVSPLLNSIITHLAPKSKLYLLRKRYSSNLNRFLYLKAKSFLFDLWWKPVSMLMPRSDINTYELYMSVLKLNPPPKP